MNLATMTQQQWDRLSPAQRELMRDNSGLTPQLLGLDGWRVEVVDPELRGGSTRRFIVGKSTGWCPCHLELANRRSDAGGPAEKSYQSVRKLYKAR